MRNDADVGGVSRDERARLGTALDPNHLQHARVQQLRVKPRIGEGSRVRRKRRGWTPGRSNVRHAACESYPLARLEIPDLDAGGSLVRSSAVWLCEDGGEPPVSADVRGERGLVLKDRDTAGSRWGTTVCAVDMTASVVNSAAASKVHISTGIMSWQMLALAMQETPALFRETGSRVTSNCFITSPILRSSSESLR